MGFLVRWKFLYLVAFMNLFGNMTWLCSRKSLVNHTKWQYLHQEIFQYNRQYQLKDLFQYKPRIPQLLKPEKGITTYLLHKAFVFFLEFTFEDEGKFKVIILASDKFSIPAFCQDDTIQLVSWQFGTEHPKFFNSFMIFGFLTLALFAKFTRFCILWSDPHFGNFWVLFSHGKKQLSFIM